MDNLTHSLVGALIGQAGLKKKTGLAMPALIIGANLPDVDAACLFWLEGVEHLGFRRGITHGPPALVLLPLILAGLLYGYDCWQAKRGKRPENRLPVSFKWLFLLSFIGCLTHPALDWLNVYGIRLLEPFSSQWFYGDTLFIIDLWLWALMGFATWFSFRREKRGGEWMRPARVAIAVALAYIGVNGVWSSILERNVASYKGVDRIDAEQIIISPVPFVPWHREILIGGKGRWYVAPEVERPWAAKPNLAAFELLGGPSCKLPAYSWVVPWSDEAVAFQFWSRAPFAERAPDGSVLLRDARFYDPRARDRFTVALPNMTCEPLAAE